MRAVATPTLRVGDGDHRGVSAALAATTDGRCAAWSAVRALCPDVSHRALSAPVCLAADTIAALLAVARRSALVARLGRLVEVVSGNERCVGWGDGRSGRRDGAPADVLADGVSGECATSAGAGLLRGRR
jgi:hypothetical protein